MMINPVQKAENGSSPPVQPAVLRDIYPNGNCIAMLRCGAHRPKVRGNYVSLNTNEASLSITAYFMSAAIFQYQPVLFRHPRFFQAIDILSMRDYYRDNIHLRHKANILCKFV
jgi:hypothetical protein